MHAGLLDGGMKLSTLLLALPVPCVALAQKTTLEKTDKIFSEAATTDKWIYNDLARGLRKRGPRADWSSKNSPQPIAEAAAKRADFRKGDVIVRYDGTNTHWREPDFFAYVLAKKKLE
jgi:hypothetical protein